MLRAEEHRLELIRYQTNALTRRQSELNRNEPKTIVVFGQRVWDGDPRPFLELTVWRITRDLQYWRFATRDVALAKGYKDRVHRTLSLSICFSRSRSLSLPLSPSLPLSLALCRCLPVFVRSCRAKPLNKLQPWERTLTLSAYTQLVEFRAISLQVAAHGP